MEANTLSIEEAADQLGVHYMTIYRYVRIGRLPAACIGRRWRIRKEDLALVAPSVVGTSGRSRRRGDGTPRAESLARASHRLRDRLVAGDTAGAWTIVESALMAGTPSDVYLHLLGPCLRTIGDDWERGRVDIADEHRASAGALGVVGRLSPLFRRRGRRRPGQVLLAGAEGDPHCIPLAMVADHLRAEGLDIVYLGADVPVETLTTRAAADLSAVGISASTTTALINAGRAIDELHRRLPGMPVMLGGPAVPTEKTARQAGADGWAADAARAAELFIGLKRSEKSA